MLLVSLDCLFQSRDFSGKLGLFLFVLSVQSGVSAIGQLSQNVALIDFTEQDFQLGHSLLGGSKACALFPDLCRLLAGLRFLYHSDKFGTVMFCIFVNGFEHFGDKRKYHIFIDTVLCLAERSDQDFGVL
ncbi:hypothetical protein ACLUXI_02080 [Bifidobacterium apri]|uniref:hypothetical protein n=1 Tax=Bifidobacterium apri TaxID=1769423 RepID=UPI003994D0F3